MSIHLITGIPGAGKTLYAVKLLVEKLIPTGRQIFTNIDGLNIDCPNLWQIDKDGAFLWPDMPHGSIIIIDECQQVFPPRNSQSSVPRHVSHFEIHRHEGKDIYLITQGPTLIDRHLWPLVETHSHLYRPFGLSRSSISTWNSINEKPNPYQSRLSAHKVNFTFPSKYFSLYKSSVQHTIKPKLPWKIIIIGISAISIIGGGSFYAYSSMSSTLKGPQASSFDALSASTSTCWPVRAYTARHLYVSTPSGSSVAVPRGLGRIERVNSSLELCRDT